MAQGAPVAFFSYCREDSDFALRLAGDLKAVGASVWLDQLDILPGQRWDRSVEDALTNCLRMVVILSPASVSSTNVMDEVSFALEEKKTVIPVVYQDCTIPFRLRRVQHVDFRQDYARGLQVLLKILAPGNAEKQQPPALASFEDDSHQVRAAAAKYVGVPADSGPPKREPVVPEHKDPALTPSPEVATATVALTTISEHDHGDAGSVATSYGVAPGSVRSTDPAVVPQPEQPKSVEESEPTTMPLAITSEPESVTRRPKKQASKSATRISLYGALFILLVTGIMLLRQLLPSARPPRIGDATPQTQSESSAPTSNGTLEPGTTQPKTTPRRQQSSPPANPQQQSNSLAPDVWQQEEADTFATDWKELNNLMWAADQSFLPVTKAEAESYCTNLRLGAYSGWRLPTIDELRGIFDENQNSDCGAFHQACHIKNGIKLSWEGVWSDTGQTFNFTDGRLGFESSSWNSSVLCVHKATPKHHNWLPEKLKHD